VTAFSAPDFGSPEHANKRLANAAFLQTRDLESYGRLILEIQRLAHPGENIPLPDSGEMGAWGRAFAIYETLRDRAVVEEHRAVQHNQAFAADEHEWNVYIESLETVLALLRRGTLDEDTLVEHLDVKLPDDLASPTPAPPKVRPHDPWCPTMQTGKTSDCKCAARRTEEHKPNGFGPDNRPLDWRSRSSRLASALRWWEALGAEARIAIKQQRALKKLQQFKEARSG
jgi:hypothetical protein